MTKLKSSERVKCIKNLAKYSSALIGVAALATGLAPSLAMAQESEDEVIVVTGSRIAQPNLVSPTPVSVFTAEQIELSGAVNTAELLRTLPAAGVSTLTSTNSNFLVGASGVNTIDLRNLTEDRTLVLVNGRRFVSGLPGTANVDFNSIPTEFIERIDVVTGGASAVYGSDALAGVVNIITKTDFEGAVASFQGGLSEEGDDETYEASLTLGANFADNRGNAVASFSWSKELGVFASQRAGLERDGLSQSFFSGDGADFQETVVPFYSSFSERGRIIVPGAGNFVFDETTGTTRPFVSANDDGSELDGFNRQAFRAIAVPTERFLFSTAVNYEVNRAFDLFFEGTYASTETQSRLEPVPLASDDVFGDNAAQFLDDDGDGVFDRSAFGISILNPFVPEGIRAATRAAADFNDDGVSDIADEDLVVGFARRTTELINRGSHNIRQTARAVAGARGAFGETWSYEVSANFGRTTQAQDSTGQVNVLNFRNALNAIEDPNAPGSFICADPLAVAQGCAPINIFGVGSISPEAAAYVRAPSSINATIEQAVLSGYVSGDLPLTLPTARDAISVAFGAEYRTERSSSIPDALSQAGLNAGNVTPVVEGRYNVSEVFGEAHVPLVTDAPFVRDLSLSVAARASDYTTVGDTFAWSASLEYAPIDSLRFRSQYSEAVRAPNIGELFQPQAETFEGGADPCQGLTLSGGTPAFLNDGTDAGSGVDASTIGSNAAAACFADPLLAARVTRDGAFAPSQAEIQGIGGFNGGNPNLSEETANTFTFGLVFSPDFGNQWLDRFSASIDYYDIEIEDAIAGIARQTSLDQCYSLSGGVYDGSSPFCSNVVRFSSGPFIGAIDELNAIQQNLATIETKGVEIQASYFVPLNDVFRGQSFDLGDVNFALNYGLLDTFEVTPFPGGAPIEDAGTAGFFDTEYLFSTVYTRGGLTVAWDVNYLDEATLAPAGEFLSDAVVPAATFHDVQVRYTLPSTGVTLVVGVDNASDEYIAYGLGLPDNPGDGTEGAIYDSFGRRWYAGVRAKF